MRKKAKEKPAVLGICAISGCDREGEYKAPKSRYNTVEYQYLCLEHVKEFNQAWDYFEGWSQKQIEDFMDAAAHGHKPTWDVSSRISGAGAFFSDDRMRERFYELLGGKPPGKTGRKNDVFGFGRKEREAFATLGLEPVRDIAMIKAKYKKLVKQHHPDVNSGDKKAEESFKKVTAAYKVLLKTYGKKDET